MKNLLIIIVVLVILALGFFGWQQGWFTPDPVDPVDPENGEEEVVEDDEENGDEEEDAEARGPVEVIGSSVNGRDVSAYRYGSGETELLFVGGIHGGYSPNTTLVVYQMMGWLEANMDLVPEDLTVTVIPVLNPDGLNEVMGTTSLFAAADIPSREERVPGRFNGGEVDLNRNFDCLWQSTGVWQDVEVDGGDSPFSEPESQALRNYVEANSIEAAVIFYAAAGEVIASSCETGISSETQELVELYANASGYEAKDSFDYYELSGDAANWLAKIGVPTISVILDSHTSAEWEKNQAGIEALLENFRN